MIVQLSFVFALTLDFRHVLQRLKHRLHDSVVGSVDAGAYVQYVSTDELRLYAVQVGRKGKNERSNASAFLAGDLRLLDILDLLALWAKRLASVKTQIGKGSSTYHMTFE